MFLLTGSSIPMPRTFSSCPICDRGKHRYECAQNLGTVNLILIRGQLGWPPNRPPAAVLKAKADGKINLVADGTGGDSWSLEEARKVVEAAIAAKKDFNVIYAENDGMAQGAVQALDAAGITHGKDGKVKILGFDFNRFASPIRAGLEDDGQGARGRGKPEKGRDRHA